MRGIRVTLLLLLCAVLLSGCGHGTRPCAELMADFCREYGEMPDGRIFYAGAEEWEEGAMPADMAGILFTEDNGENAFPLCTDYALFLSSSYGGGEILFLRAADRADAVRLSEMCSARLARFARILPNAPVLTDACVLREGNTVVLLLLPDNGRAKLICRGLL